jgi:hypothetical protein
MRSKNDGAFADDEAFSNMVYEAIRVALAEEDAPMAGSVQRKLDLGLVDQLIYGRNELILQHNHEGWVAPLAMFTRTREPVNERGCNDS